MPSSPAWGGVFLSNVSTEGDSVRVKIGAIGIMFLRNINSFFRVWSINEIPTSSRNFRRKYSLGNAGLPSMQGGGFLKRESLGGS